MSKPDEKPLQPISQSLFAFNNRIVSIKPTIKKAKILIIRKLKRQINVLKNKKGNDNQKAKNQRKADKLNEEINLIKKLKFNDICIYCMENELTFDQVLKSKPQIDLNEKSLAKLSLHKLIINEINKIKIIEKDWKTILIQYKSRIEKKRSWKEKQKFHKEIEESLNKLQNEDEEKTKINNDGGDDNDVNNNDDDDDDDDDESLNDEDEDDVDDEKVNINSNNEDDSDSDSEGDEKKEKEVVKANKIELKSETINKASQKIQKNNIISPIVDVKTNYKPRINTTSKEMVIKQIALDELENLDEIPINNNEINNQEAAEEDKIEKTVKKSLSNGVTSDPFFISVNGGLNIVDTSNVRTDDSIRDNYDDDDDDGYNNNRFKNSKYLNSTFTNLSSRENKQPFDKNQNRFQKNGKFNNNYNYDDKFKRKFDNYNESNGFKKNDKFKRDHNGFKKFDNDRQFNKNNYERKEKPKPVEDISDLHPSWIAKKEQEEKLKSLKFQGTKVKFDDDDDYQPKLRPNNNEKKERQKSIQNFSNLHPSWIAKKQEEEKLKSLKFQGTKVKFDDND